VKEKGWRIVGSRGEKVKISLDVIGMHENIIKV
jgi:hypothetical protein